MTIEGMSMIIWTMPQVLILTSLAIANLHIIILQQIKKKDDQYRKRGMFYQKLNTAYKGMNRKF